MREQVGLFGTLTGSPAGEREQGADQASRVRQPQSGVGMADVLPLPRRDDDGRRGGAVDERRGDRDASGAGAGAGATSTAARTIAVLKGGRSLERGVSLRSGAQVEDSLQRLGHSAVSTDVGAELVTQLRAAAPDAAFIAMHGGDGEDGTVQELLAAIGVPYTGSGPAACVRCADKVLAKYLLREAGIPTPDVPRLQRVLVQGARRRRSAQRRRARHRISAGRQARLPGLRAGREVRALGLGGARRAGVGLLL